MENIVIISIAAMYVVGSIIKRVLHYNFVFRYTKYLNEKVPAEKMDAIGKAVKDSIPQELVKLPDLNFHKP